MKQKNTPEDFGFSVVDLGNIDLESNLMNLIEKGHKVTIDCVMMNGHLRGIVTPAIESDVSSA